MFKMVSPRTPPPPGPLSASSLVPTHIRNSVRREIKNTPSHTPHHQTRAGARTRTVRTPNVTLKDFYVGEDIPVRTSPNQQKKQRKQRLPVIRDGDKSDVQATKVSNINDDMDDDIIIWTIWAICGWR